MAHYEIPEKDLVSLIEIINNDVEALRTTSGPEKEAARLRSLKDARTLISILQSPAEIIFQHAFSVC
jgi:hypothetical protein